MKRSNPDLTPELWRLSIIADLIHREVDDGRTLHQRLCDLADKTWIRIDGTPCKFSHETIRKWYSRFQAGGLTALSDTRSCPGTQIPEKLADALIALRQQHPNWTVKLLTEHLHQSGDWNGRDPSLATLYRWCKARGLLRSREQDQPSARAFEFTTFGGLWISDVLHGPKVIVQGKKRKAYLLAILDDASRFIVSARFHLSEGIEPLMIDLRRALIRFGVPKRFYTDNGAAFRSRIIHQVGARLNIAMPHSPPYKPQGRGKIERFFLTVRERFLAKNNAKTLEQLNRDLQEWIAEYHQTPHGGIKEMTPLDKRMQIENLCRTLPESANIDPLFMQSRQARLTKDGTFRLQNQIFEAAEASKSKRIEIFFYPWDLKTVFYGEERRPARLLDKHENARRHERIQNQEVSYG